MAIISIVQRKNMEKRLRMDAEYYQPVYLEIEKKMKRHPCKKLGDLISVLTDYHANGSYEMLRRHVQLLDKPDYALMIRTVDLERDDFEKDVKYVSREAYSFLSKTRLSGKEIIINKIGHPGRVYIVPPLNKKMTLGMNLFMLRPKKEITSGYLYAYLSCGYGRRLLEQRITGAVPLSIDKESVRSVIVPVFSKALQKEMDKIMDHHFALRNQSKKLYSQAEQLLLAELGLKDWKPQQARTFVRNCSQIAKTGRLDAEHFHPKYREMFNKLPKNVRLQPLGGMAMMTKGIEVGSSAYTESGMPFWRVSNLSKHGMIDDPLNYISNELYHSLREKYEPRPGEILLSKDATPGTAYYLDEPLPGIISGGILRLSLADQIPPYYLELVLNSVFVQLQIEQSAGGSIIKHWQPSQVQKTWIPRLSMDKEKEISSFVHQSRMAKRKAKTLLEKARDAVETAIEYGERQAMNYLSK